MGVPIIRTIVFWGLYLGPLYIYIYMEDSLNYCSPNGGNVYRDPYYNWNLNIGPRIDSNLGQSPYRYIYRERGRKREFGTPRTTGNFRYVAAARLAPIRGAKKLPTTGA